MSSLSPTEERPSSRRRTGILLESLAFRPIRKGPAEEASSLSRAGTLVLRSSIPAFEEGSIYIPTGAENGLSYTTLQAWWEAAISSQKDPKVVLYSIERVLRQILSCSDRLAYGLVRNSRQRVPNPDLSASAWHREEQRMWNYLRDQSDI